MSSDDAIDGGGEFPVRSSVGATSDSSFFLSTTSTGGLVEPSGFLDCDLAVTAAVAAEKVDSVESLTAVADEDFTT